jgi:hypothetical protein
MRACRRGTVVSMIEAGTKIDPGPPLWPALIGLPITALTLLPAIFVWGSLWTAWWSFVLPPMIGLGALLPRRSAAFGFGLIFGWVVAQLLVVLILLVNL